ncbi:F510_1955 family glycosylhydrolase [Paraconexibacter sp.]|uniref:F510_1955 family glycosylhydrolase n=1 Tax=Paraconexibacter sp. TaxID=2949640 RepID=UPI00356375C1
MTSVVPDQFAADVRAGAVEPRPPAVRGSRLLVALLVTLVALVAGCGEGSETAERHGEGRAVVGGGPQHVHGLGVDATDLYIASHTGLWRAPAGETKAQRVGDIRHDLMGFTVVGPDHFLASGHPDARQDLPPRMGLQRSTDAGRSWETVSLLGEADLHVLRAAGRRIYGVDSGTGTFLTSADNGRTWQQRTPPAPVFDLAVAHDPSRRLVIATERGLFSSLDTGRTWRRLRDDLAGLLAWPGGEALYLVDGQGAVMRSADAGRTFRQVGEVGSQPQAFIATSARELYAAVQGGVVLMSSDGGASWRTRSTP